jgi:hypothetical protein
MTRWWASEGPPERASDIARSEPLPLVEAPPVSESDLRREAIETTRKLIEALPDRQ